MEEMELPDVKVRNGSYEGVTAWESVLSHSCFLVDLMG